MGAGIVFRYQNDKNAYLAGIGILGTHIALAKYNSAEDIEIIQSDGNPETLIMSDIWYALKVVFYESNIRIYLNNTLELDITDSSQNKKGSFGLFALTADIVCFDDFKVQIEFPFPVQIFTLSEVSFDPSLSRPTNPVDPTGPTDPSNPSDPTDPADPNKIPTSVSVSLIVCLISIVIGAAILVANPELQSHLGFRDRRKNRKHLAPGDLHPASPHPKPIQNETQFHSLFGKLPPEYQELVLNAEKAFKLGASLDAIKQYSALAIKLDDQGYSYFSLICQTKAEEIQMLLYMHERLESELCMNSTSDKKIQARQTILALLEVSQKLNDLESMMVYMSKLVEISKK